MDVQSVYEALGIDFSDVLALLRKEDRIALYLEQTMCDPAFQTLDEAMSRQDWEAAFRAAHTIKGMALNLMLEPLAHAAIDLVECLRGGAPDEREARELYDSLRTRIADIERFMSCDAAKAATIPDLNGSAL
ncbi:Hpt domain-containing protein [Raoultibacter massiliensis]|uniref:Hpt domain-containing protein n=1 Tax=Raoultibacter massiliensis TaxID=1852371 RepID=A0ABV1JEL0_9ACTN|nr:Hpt domain-containing protein [Raoultibacter massiliensis]